MSILLVTASLTAVLVVAIPALQELARAARSAEKLFDTLARDLPPTLNAIRNTGLEITDLTEDVSEGVKSASQVVKQVDRSLDGARRQAQNVQSGTRSFFVGVKTAWKTFTRQKPSRRVIERLPATEREAIRQEYRRTKPESLPTIHDDYSETDNWNNNFDDED
ncbi:hypothetical protein [Fortiea contorta]|uniref:hypothetical protein n=1 Tax=Fortiea contorta TaxID=1892405 RepID=UPI00034BD82D